MDIIQDSPPIRVQIFSKLYAKISIKQNFPKKIQKIVFLTSYLINPKGMVSMSSFKGVRPKRYIKKGANFG